MNENSLADRIVASLPRHDGVIRLAVCCLLIGLVWGIVLPKISALSQMQSYKIWLDDRGVDPSAMYYTELEAIEPILHRLERSGR